MTSAKQYTQDKQNLTLVVTKNSNHTKYILMSSIKIYMSTKKSPHEKKKANFCSIRKHFTPFLSKRPRNIDFQVKKLVPTLQTKGATQPPLPIPKTTCQYCSTKTHTCLTKSQCDLTKHHFITRLKQWNLTKPHFITRLKQCNLKKIPFHYQI